ncbi:MAG: 4-alpha-glucanotransferase [Planctomycetia bacterium]
MSDESASIPPTTEVADLAHAFGVATEYYTQQGDRVIVDGQTIDRVLAAIHVDASTDAGRAAAWDRVTNGPWRRSLPFVVVARQGHHRQFQAHAPTGTTIAAWVDFEEGGRRTLPHPHEHGLRDIDGRAIRELAFDVPTDLPLGWHTIHATLHDADGRPSAAPCVLVVTPDRLEMPAAMSNRRTWGLMAQLYATRSHESWGLGDLHDLASLATWGGEYGAGFVLVNPMHAAEVSPPMAPSPYLPATRRFFNPIYLHIEDIPEYSTLSESDRERIAALARPLMPRNSTADLLDRDAVWQAKKESLEILLSAPLAAARQQSFEAFRRREGEGLDLYATWCAFAEAWGIHTCDWPPGARHHDGPDVPALRQRFATRIEFFATLQWLLDEQLARVQAAARAAGMTAGIVHDLAVGVHPEGADAWALQDVLAHDISVGAPPDMYNQLGQDWSQPPWRPDALEAAAYIPYRDMLRTILRHSGGIRVDHALGLFRLWWIPRDTPASRGTFVRYDHEALVGILALEAHRAGAFVVGEDLGTFDGWVRTYLDDRGIAGTSILWFEGEHGSPLAPERWRENCLGTVTVHDLPPTAGYIGGEHVRLRHELGLLTNDAGHEWESHWQWLVAWENLLRQRGLLAPSVGRATDFRQEVVEALHRLLAQSPCRLLAVAVPDLVGDVRAQNQPGTFREYPNWQIPTCRADGAPLVIEDLRGDRIVAERCRRLLDAFRQ